MGRSLVITVAVFLVFWAFTARGDDGADQIAGAWQQIESNAGACPQCRISIDQHGSSLTVTANNGWSASLVAGQKDGSINATGIGRWRSSLTGAMAGKRFNVDFVLKDQRLYMSMRVDMGNGSRRTIQGVFGRIWSGV
jgi:hypothetical protein